MLYPPGKWLHTHWIGDWVSPRAGLKAVEKRKIFCFCRESNPGRPALSPSLYRLSYPSSERVQSWILILFFLISIVGGGVQLGPLGTATTNRPIVPAPGDYDDGEIGGMITRGNRSTRRKPTPVPLSPLQTPHAARARTRAAAILITIIISMRPTI
jgi:hypothetical protein